MVRFAPLAAASLAAWLGGAAIAAAQQACPVPLGGILTLTGTMGDIGKRIAETAQMAVEQVNAAGGVKGCPVNFILRDDQGQPQVGVDAAKNLVEVSRVPAIIGSIGSGVSLPILTSVAVPGKVAMISCCSTAPTFTTLAKEGKTQGYWFRTLPTSLLQAVTSAKITVDNGWKRTAIIYVNTDFGVNMAKDFERVIGKLGGSVTVSVPFNENQPSYRAEVQKALSVQADSMFLVAFPQDGSAIARDWVSLGGTQNLVLNNALRSDQFLANVGARFLNNAWGMDNAQVQGATVDQFNTDYQAKFSRPPNGPGLHTVYDAVVATALAMQAAPAIDGTNIRDHLRKVTDPKGEQVGPGVEGIKKAVELLKAGKAIRYVGATGPFQFDENGDVSGPSLVWRFKEGKIEQVKVNTIDEMTALFAQVNK